MGQQLSERLGQLMAGDLLRIDLQAFEEGLVEESPLDAFRLSVGGLDVLGQPQGDVKRLQQHVVLNVQAGHQFVGSHPLPSDASLFLSEELVGDPVGVVGGEQLALLPLQPGEISPGSPDLRRSQAREPLQMLAHCTPDARPACGCQLDGRVVPLHGLLDSFGPVVGL